MKFIFLEIKHLKIIEALKILNIDHHFNIIAI